MSPRSPADRVSRVDQRRNTVEILRVAARLLASDPGASMQSIADAAGVTRLTVYRHFANRQTLEVALLTAIDDQAELILEDLPEWDAGAGTLRQLITALVDLVRAYPVIIARHQVESGDRRSPMDGRLSAVLERGQRSGVLRDDLPPDVLNATLFAVITAHIRLRPGLGSAQLADGIADLILEGLSRSAAPSAAGSAPN